MVESAISTDIIPVAVAKSVQAVAQVKVVADAVTVAITGQVVAVA
jgi:hypothetical protein